MTRDGFQRLPALLTKAEIADVHAYFATRPARDPYRRELGRFTAPADVPPETHVAYFDDADVLDCPHLARVATDSRVLAAVEAYLGGPATISALRAWWSTPTPDGGAEHAEMFHRDVDDFRFAKLFVYLTDVDDEAGPHLFVRGSHRANRLTAIRRYTDAEVEDAFGAENFVRFTGPAGTSLSRPLPGCTGASPRPPSRAWYSSRSTRHVRPFMHPSSRSVLGATAMDLLHTR